MNDSRDDESLKQVCNNKVDESKSKNCEFPPERDLVLRVIQNEFEPGVDPLDWVEDQKDHEDCADDEREKEAKIGRDLFSEGSSY